MLLINFRRGTITHVFYFKSDELVASLVISVSLL